MLFKIIRNGCLVLLVLLSKPSISQWVPAQGPETGVVRCMAADGNLLYAGTEQGVFLSTDNGASWIDIDLQFPNKIIFGLTVYKHVLYSLRDQGVIYYYEEKNKKWIHANDGIQPYQMIQEAIPGSDGAVVDREEGDKIITLTVKDGNLYAIGNSMYLLNKDNTWKMTDLEQGYVNPGKNILAPSFYNNHQVQLWAPVKSKQVNVGTDIVLTNANNIFCVVRGGGLEANGYLSFNSGSSWERAIKLPFTPDDFFVTGDVIYIWTTEFPLNACRSFDRGKTWNKLAMVPNQILKKGAFLFAATNDGVFRSGDEGKTWVKTSAGLFNGDIAELFTVENTLIALHSFQNGKVFRYDNKAWKDITPGKGVRTMIRNGTFLIAVTFQGELFRSGDKGSSWDAIKSLPADSKDLNKVELKKGSVVVTTNGGQEYISFDNGNSWSGSSSVSNQDEAEMAPIRTENLVFSSLAATDSTLLAGSPNGILVSRNHGRSWIPGMLFGQNIVAVAVTTKGILELQASDELSMSKDGGLTWVPIKLGSSPINSLETDKNFVMVKNKKGESYLSSDGGETWNIISGLAGHNINCLANVNELIYAADGLEVLSSIDNGITWKIMPKPFHNKEIASITAYEKKLWVLTERVLYVSDTKAGPWDSVALSESDAPYQKIAYGNNCLVTGSAKGISLSEDGGKTWTKPDNKGFPGEAVIKSLHVGNSIICVKRGMHNEEDSLFISNDKGKTWKCIFEPGWKINHKLEELKVTEVATIGSRIVLGTDGNGIMLSDDNGKSWTETEAGSKWSYVHSLVSCDDVLLALGCENYYDDRTGPFAPRISRDKGETWTKLGTLLDKKNKDTLKWGAMFCLHSSAGSKLIVNTAGDVYVSSDKGQSWTATGFPSKRKQDTYTPVARAIAVKGSSVFLAPEMDFPSDGRMVVMIGDPPPFSRGGGLWRYEENEKKWKKTDHGLTDSTITAIATTTDVVLVLTPSGIFRSKDDGLSWTKLNDEKHFGAIGFLTSKNNIVYIGGSEGVFASPNNGDSWDKIAPFFCWPHGRIAAWGQGLFVQDASANIFYAKTPDYSWSVVSEQGFSSGDISSVVMDQSKITIYGFAGILSSEDDGRHWQQKSQFSSVPEMGGSQGILDSDGKYLYNRTRHYGILRSSDGGHTWVTMNNGLPTYTNTSWNRTTGIISYPGCILVGITTPEGFVGEFMSQNDGKTWHLVNNGLPPDASVNGIVKHGHKYVAATSLGLYISDRKGVKWTRLKGDGLNVQYIREVHSIGGSLLATVQSSKKNVAWPDIYYTNGAYSSKEDNSWTGSGIYISNNDGETWTPLNSKLNEDYIDATIVSGNNILVNAYERDNVFDGNYGSRAYATDWNKKLRSKILLSSDKGVHWKEVKSGFPGNASVTKMFCVNDAVFACIADSGLYRSLDHGEQWSSISVPVQDPEYNCVSTENRLWVGSSMELYSSDNLGDTWVLQTGETIPKSVVSYSGNAHQLFLYGGSAENIPGRMLISSDMGMTWKRVGNGLPEELVTRGICVINSTVFLPTFNALYKSEDKGRTWSNPNPSICLDYNLSVAAGRDCLYAFAKNLTSFGAKTNGWKSPSSVLLSKDNGVSWKDASSGLANISGRSVSLYTCKNGVLAQTSSGLFERNGAESDWSLVTKENHENGRPVSAGNLIIETNFIGGVSTNIYSPDGGRTWCGSGLDTVFSPLFIHVKVQDGEKLYAGCENGLFYSLDGLNWKFISGGNTTQLAVKDQSVARVVRMYPGSTELLTISIDMGKTWSDRKNSFLLEGVQITGLAILDNMLYASTSGQSVWKMVLTNEKDK